MIINDKILFFIREEGESERERERVTILLLNLQLRWRIHNNEISSVYYYIAPPTALNLPLQYTNTDFKHELQLRSVIVIYPSLYATRNFSRFACFAIPTVVSQEPARIQCNLKLPPVSLLCTKYTETKIITPTFFHILQIGLGELVQNTKTVILLYDYIVQCSRIDFLFCVFFLNNKFSLIYEKN